MNDTSFVEPLSEADFSELLIRHMILSPEVYAKAASLKLTGDDMMIDATYGNDIYKEFINIINSIETKPISAYSIFHALKHKFEAGTLSNGVKENTLEFLQYIFDDARPLEKPEFFDKKLTEFVKSRRAKKIIAEYKDDVVGLTRELNKLSIDIVEDSPLSRPRIINPFVNAIFKTKTAMIGTGLSRLDSKLDGGLKLGEYAMLIGFSGGGKTAVGTNMVGLSAEMGRPSTYISCEEHEDDLSQRFYSRVFRIPYKNLRSGVANIELESVFNEEMTRIKRETLAKNMNLIGLKGVGDAVTPNYIYELMLQHYEKTGFVPEFTMLDQLQFIHPDGHISKSAQGWEIENIVARELDQLSHRQIGGKNFVLWVQHQAKGKTKPYFTKDEIQGYKSIDNTPDLVLGVGRANEKANEINLFPIKIRHSAQFRITLKTEFQFMTVTSTEVSDTLPDQEAVTENPTMTTVNYDPIIPTNPFN